MGGDWVASDLAAGISSNESFFGDGDDLVISSANPSIFSRIASITIKGQLLGTPATTNNTDHYGFAAQEIGAFSVGGLKLKLTPKVMDPAVTFSLNTINDRDLGGTSGVGAGGRKKSSKAVQISTADLALLVSMPWLGTTSATR